MLATFFKPEGGFFKKVVNVPSKVEPEKGQPISV